MERCELSPSFSSLVSTTLGPEMSAAVTESPPLSSLEDKLWLKPYVDLQAYEDPAQGALDFTQELDPDWLIVDTVIGEGEPCHAQ